MFDGLGDSGLPALEAGGLGCAPTGGYCPPCWTNLYVREAGGTAFYPLDYRWDAGYDWESEQLSFVERELGESRVSELLDALEPWGGHMAWVDCKLGCLVGRVETTRAAWLTFDPVAPGGWEGLCARAALWLDDEAVNPGPDQALGAAQALRSLRAAAALPPAGRERLESLLKGAQQPDMLLAMAAAGGDARPDAMAARAALKGALMRERRPAEDLRRASAQAAQSARRPSGLTGAPGARRQ